jgi:hypothetical protein
MGASERRYLMVAFGVKKYLESITGIEQIRFSWQQKELSDSLLILEIMLYIVLLLWYCSRFSG